ncbi:hypothetical protein LXL04_024023 [Taraxacum kok-saghyz]
MRESQLYIAPFFPLLKFFPTEFSLANMHVDDLISTGKDLNRGLDEAGKMCYFLFLGVEIDQLEKGIFPCQKEYQVLAKLNGEYPVSNNVGTNYTQNMHKIR